VVDYWLESIMTDRDYVTIQLELPMGQGTSDDQWLSLVRPFRRLATQGRPIGRINYIFFNIEGQHYNVGSLCYTPGNRVLFFPGLRSRPPQWQGWRNRRIEIEVCPGDQLDHVTLEPELTNWHMRYLSSQGGRRRLPDEPNVPRRFRTFEKDGLIFWFSMAIREPTVLENTLAITIMRFDFPSTDAERRVSDIMRSREDAAFHVLELHPTVENYNSGYLFFSFVIDTRTEPSISGLSRAIMNASTRPPHLEQAIQEQRLRIPIRSHPVRLPGFRFPIWVSVGVIPARLSLPAVFIAYDPPEKFNTNSCEH